MGHVELNSKQRERLFKALTEMEINPHDFGVYLREKINEDRGINSLKETTMSKADFNERKALLVSMEYLSVVLTKE